MNKEKRSANVTNRCNESARCIIEWTAHVRMSFCNIMFMEIQKFLQLCWHPAAQGGEIYKCKQNNIPKCN